MKTMLCLLLLTACVARAQTSDATFCTVLVQNQGCDPVDVNWDGFCIAGGNAVLGGSGDFMLGPHAQALLSAGNPWYLAAYPASWASGWNFLIDGRNYSGPCTVVLGVSCQTGIGSTNQVSYTNQYIGPARWGAAPVFVRCTNASGVVTHKLWKIIRARKPGGV